MIKRGEHRATTVCYLCGEKFNWKSNHLKKSETIVIIQENIKVLQIQYVYSIFYIHILFLFLFLIFLKNAEISKGFGFLWTAKKLRKKYFLCVA